MSLLSNLKEKVSHQKSAPNGKSFEEEMENLDNMIEDLFKMDSHNSENQKEKKEE